MEVNVIISDKPLCLPDLTTSVERIERTAAAAGVLPNTVCGSYKVSLENYT